MKLATFILTFSLICSCAQAQSQVKSQLFAGPATNLIDYNSSNTTVAAFADVDDFVISMKTEKVATHHDLAKYLTTSLIDEAKKVRSIYTWIAMNITYDHEALITGDFDSQAAPDVWQSRMAVCEGYSNLFNEMCASVGIESRIVKGYVKVFAGDDLQSPNHAWNSVKIDGKWNLLDVTWASMNNELDQIPENGKNIDFARKKLDYFFMVNPAKMILTHLPEDPYWQLQSNLISMDIFEKGTSNITLEVQKPPAHHYDFEQLITAHEQLDSLDKSIALMERMVQTSDYKTVAYGLGIAYYYKAQAIMKEAANDLSGKVNNAKNRARQYYQKAYDQLTLLKQNDFGYDFSQDLLENVAFKIEVL